MPSWAWKIGLSLRLRWKTSSKNAPMRSSSVCGFAAVPVSWAKAGVIASAVDMARPANAAKRGSKAVIQISWVETAAKLAAWDLEQGSVHRAGPALRLSGNAGHGPDARAGR